MRLESNVRSVHRYLVSNESSSQRSQSKSVLLYECDRSRHELQQQSGGRDNMLHYRLKLLTECHRHLRHTLASLVKSGLNRTVLHIKLIRDRCTLCKRLSCFLLLPTHHIEVASKSRNHLRSSRSVLAHILEYRSQYVDVAKLMQSV